MLKIWLNSELYLNSEMNLNSEKFNWIQARQRKSEINRGANQWNVQNNSKSLKNIDFEFSISNSTIILHNLSWLNSLLSWNNWLK